MQCVFRTCLGPVVPVPNSDDNKLLLCEGCDTYIRWWSKEVMAAAPEKPCGGCNRLGAHKRWCEEDAGREAHLLGTMGDQLEEMGDRLGLEDWDHANRLYELSASMIQTANRRKLAYKRRVVTK